jgi:hypothetical protein
LSVALASSSAIPDRPFLQDAASRIRLAPELQQAEFQRLEIDQDGIVYVLTDRGVARLFDDLLAIDRSFRPLTPLRARDIALTQGVLYYLFEDRWLSNGKAGRPLGHFAQGEFSGLAVADDGTVLASGSTSLGIFSGDKTRRTLELSAEFLPAPKKWLAKDGEFYAVRPDAILRLRADQSLSIVHRGSNLTALAFQDGEMLVGSGSGFYGLDLITGKTRTALQTSIPCREITCLMPVADGIWAGTTRGLFFQRTRPASTRLPSLPDGPNGIRYYSGRRWLLDDHVVDLKREPAGHLLVLTKSGLNRIEMRPWTLAAKAEWFDRKVRQRHMRFGLTAERRLPVAGDISGSEIIDTDNDGGWSSYYLASQAFRFAVTGDAAARSHAWETFAALERLRELAGTNGFFARTFERKGFKYSDTDRWRDLPGNDWEWKGHTSSDEFTSHTFAHAVLWEFVARPGAERQRIASNYVAILNHIIQHDWHLVDVDGQPTLWGRWHPDYVNHYPPSIGDRRLNSAEIIAGLQLAWKMTGHPLYRQKADELFQRHGYLTNILSPMKLIAPTPGFVHLGNDMGDEWNHSDDELAFVNYWTLHRFAFNRGLQHQYARAIREHWEFERPEKYPIWNFLHSAAGGGGDCDADGAVWTLRAWPLDTVTWRVQNSHRHDLTKLPKNFYRREMAELLPPGERPYSRLNTQPFLLDGGDGGHIELPGDEFLFGYWLGRRQGLIR